MAKRPVRLEVRLRSSELEAGRSAAAAKSESLSEFVRRVVGDWVDDRPSSTVTNRSEAGVVEAARWREEFLDALRRGCSVSEACRVAGVSRSAVYRERSRSREFAIGWELAHADSESRLRQDLQKGTAAPVAFPPRAAVRVSPGRTGRVQIRLEVEELEAWRLAALELGVSVSSLVRRLLRAATGMPQTGETPVGSWRTAFIDALAWYGSVAQAAAAAGVSRTLVYEQRRKSPAFAFAWKVAEGDWHDRHVEMLYNLAVAGVPVVERTVVTTAQREVTTVTETRRRSARALMELLKLVEPEKYDVR